MLKDITGNEMTPFVAITRSIRILHGERILDMAFRLGFTSAELSGFECGRAEWPDDIVQRIVRMYALPAEAVIHMKNVKANGNKAFLTDIGDAPQKAITTMNSVKPQGKNQPYNETWIINAPWAHPLWNQYAVLLFDLSTPMAGHPEPIIKYEGATHEVMVWAVDPSQEFTEQIEIEPPASFQSRFLRPMNHGYQFTSDSDVAARDYIQAIVQMIENRCLSPDTGFRKTWDRLFIQGMSMRKPVTTDDIRSFYEKLGLEMDDRSSAMVFDLKSEREKRDD